MNFSTLFRLEENLHLDKKTLVVLRWIAIIGQSLAVFVSYSIIEVDFNLVATISLIFLLLLFY